MLEDSPEAAAVLDNTLEAAGVLEDAPEAAYVFPLPYSLGQALSY